jgi:hypothetical protein
MKASELQSWLRSLNGGWLDPDKTVDTFKAGAPEAPVRGIAVGWMSYRWALEKALALGCNVFITHEPTYYHHHDNDERVFRLPGVQEKRRFIEESGLVIIRCHDLWDQMPTVGIPDSWGALLGLGEAIDSQGYYRVYDVAGRTAGDVARQVASRTAQLGQEAVQLIGPGEAPVTRAAIGTGAITPFMGFVADYHADLGICTDDGIAYWRDGAFAIDAGIPLIVVHHAVSEEAGMINLAAYLRDHFPDVPVHHIPQRCMFRLIQ